MPCDGATCNLIQTGGALTCVYSESEQAKPQDQTIKGNRKLSSKFQTTCHV